METESATEAEFTDGLLDLLSSGGSDLLDEVQDVSTFEGAGVMTRNAGLVLRLADGSEFQLTVVRSR